MPFPPASLLSADPAGGCQMTLTTRGKRMWQNNIQARSLKTRVLSLGLPLSSCDTSGVSLRMCEVSFMHAKLG